MNEKKSNDYIVRGMACENQVRFFAAVSTDTAEQARITHNLSPVVTNALGRLLTGGALMGAMMKNDTDKLTLRVTCQGPVKGMLVTADAKGNVKGYAAETDVNLKSGEVSKAVDLGVLSVIKDIGMKEPYVGDTHLVAGNIAEDLTYYFATSDQIPSSVSLGVLFNDDTSVRAAGGFIIQLMPFASDETIDFLEERLKDFSYTELLDKGLSPEDIINKLFEGYDTEFTDKLPCAYVCDCSRERVEQAVISLGRKEISAMIAEDKPVEVVCDFCRTKYSFSPEELLKFLKERRV